MSRESTGYLADLRAAKPTTETEWLMMGGERPLPISTRDHAVHDAVASLDERSRLVIEAIFYEGLSYSELAERFNYQHKPYMWRLVKSAIAKLKDALSHDHRFDHLFTEDMGGSLRTDRPQLRTNQPTPPRTT